LIKGSKLLGTPKVKPPNRVVFSLASFIELKTRTIRTTQPSRLLTGPRLPAAGGRRREATGTADTRSLQATLGAPKGSLVSTRSLSLVRAFLVIFAFGSYIEYHATLFSSQLIFASRVLVMGIISLLPKKKYHCVVYIISLHAEYYFQLQVEKYQLFFYCVPSYYLL